MNPSFCTKLGARVVGAKLGVKIYGAELGASHSGAEPLSTMPRSSAPETLVPRCVSSAPAPMAPS